MVKLPVSVYTDRLTAARIRRRSKKFYYLSIAGVVVILLFSLITITPNFFLA